MDFSLSPSQSDLQGRARAFAREVLRPASDRYDRSGAWADDVFRAAWEAGFLQAAVPADLGGPGFSQVDEVVLAEELGWGCAGLYTAITANNLAATPLLIAGSPEQRRTWLAPFLEAPRFAAFALTEEGAGSDAGAVQTTAQRRGDRYVLNGSKCYCTSGGHADFIVVFASTDPARGVRGLSAFIVPGNAPGLLRGPALDKLGHRASEQVELRFQDAELPLGALLGSEGMGFAIAMRTLDRTRAIVAAGAVGLARAAHELALDHARSRVQFGKPIISQEAIGFMLADMATRIEAARWLTFRAAWLADRGRRNAKESAMAKTFASDTAMEVSSDALQILGGRGYSLDTPAEKYFRDAKLFQIYEGTNQIQRLVIAREIQQGD